MAVFEGKGEKTRKRRLAAPKSDEGGGFGGKEGAADYRTTDYGTTGLKFGFGFALTVLGE
jgi:hypothetical protein